MSPGYAKKESSEEKASRIRKTGAVFAAQILATFALTAAVQWGFRAFYEAVAPSRNELSSSDESSLAQLGFWATAIIAIVAATVSASDAYANTRHDGSIDWGSGFTRQLFIGTAVFAIAWGGFFVAGYYNPA